MEELFNFSSPLQSLSSVVCSSPCTGHLYPLLFIPRYLILPEAIVNEVLSLYSFSKCSLVMCRKATDFCKLILYPVTLPKLFMVFKSFWVEFFGSLRYRSFHLQIGII
jgi:hypothetical protein